MEKYIVAKSRSDEAPVVITDTWNRIKENGTWKNIETPDATAMMNDYAMVQDESEATKLFQEASASAGV